MFLKAGALSLALLLASRLLGLVRESVQAAAFGTSGLADVAVLMLTLPDWVAGLLASGALAYVLVPAWAGQQPAQVQATQRKLGWALLAAGSALGLLLVSLRPLAVSGLAAGLPPAMRPAAAHALIWSAVAIPAALLAALWTTRLQHERDFTGMYFANLVVNVVLIAAIAWAGDKASTVRAMQWLGAGLLMAMLLRLAWLYWRAPQQATDATAATGSSIALPDPPVWMWAALSAGLPLALPFVARSIASRAGEGALATFSYSWKLLELPLMLAIQLVATLAFPAIAKAVARGDSTATTVAVRSAFALAFALACACAAALLVAAPALAQLLFGWGRMKPEALIRVAQWGAVGAWGLLPQALIAVALTALAARGRMKAAVIAYGLALMTLLIYGFGGPADGYRLMALLNLLLGVIAIVVIVALGSDARAWLPARSMLISLTCLSMFAAGVAAQNQPPSSWGLLWGLVAAGIAATSVMALTWWGSADLRMALAR